MLKVNCFGSFLLFLIVSFALTDNSYAIPEFARKYKTSCVTCHSVYPKLNPFGEVFRINGYRFPEGDEEKVKVEPVKLGAEAYKRVWPDAVWPSDMPSYSPLSFRSKMAYTVEEDDEGVLVSEFGLPSLQMMASGTFGEGVSFFVGAHLFEQNESGSIDRLFLRFNDLLTSFIPDKSLYLRVGQFIPDIVPFASNHRGLTVTPYAFNNYSPAQGHSFSGGHAHGTAPFGIEQFQLGVEAGGVLSSRFRYVLGLVNGNGISEDNNSSRDVYARLSYKFGGLAFDGTGAVGSATSSLEKSFAVGVFGYSGTGTENKANYNFNRIGSDINFYLDKLNLIGGYIRGVDGLEEDEYSLFFAEADYSLYPWLTCILRYEQANLEHEDINIKRLVANITALHYANIKFLVESRFNPDDYKFDNLYLGMDFAF